MTTEHLTASLDRLADELGGAEGEAREACAAQPEQYRREAETGHILGLCLGAACELRALAEAVRRCGVTEPLMAQAA